MDVLLTDGGMFSFVAPLAVHVFVVYSPVYVEEMLPNAFRETHCIKAEKDVRLSETLK